MWINVLDGRTRSHQHCVTKMTVQHAILNRRMGQVHADVECEILLALYVDLGSHEKSYSVCSFVHGLCQSTDCEC